MGWAFGSQLRTAALECLRAVVKAAGGVAALQPPLGASVKSHMQTIVHDKSAHVQSLALRMQDEFDGVTTMDE